MERRFMSGLMRALAAPGAGPMPSPKARRNSGLGVEHACAIIAKPTASDAELREALLQIGQTVQTEMLHAIMLSRRVRELEAELDRLKRKGA